MYHLKKIKEEDLKKIPEKIRNEIIALKDASGNYDEDLYDIMKDNDKRLYDLANKHLTKSAAPAKKKPTPKKKTPAAPKKPNYKKGDFVYLLNHEKKAYARASYQSCKLNASKSEYLIKVKLGNGSTKEVLQSKIRKTKPSDYNELVIPIKKKTPAKTPTQEVPDFSWKKITDVKTLTPVTRKCHEHFTLAKGGEKVSIKATGDTSKIVVAKKGEYIMFNSKGYVTHIKNAEAFKSDCAKIKAEEIKNRPPKAEDKKEKIPVPPKSKKETKPAQKKVEKKKNTPAKKKRSVCTIEHETAIPSVVKHLIGHVSDWHNNKISFQIKEVYRVDDTIIIAKADYKGFKGVLAFIGKESAYTYHKMCVQTGNLTKVEKPKGRPVISKKRINQMYKLYNFADLECAKLYREILACTLKGKCSHEQKNTFDKLAQKCSNFIKTIETTPNLRSAYYDEVRNRRKDGEDWNAARTRVTKELRKEAVKMV